MNVRAVKKEDFNQLQQIYEKYFSKEFEFPDFLTKYLYAFVIESDNGVIVTAGGVRTIAEAVMITNKDIDIHNRRKALQVMLTGMKYITGNWGYNQLHAFVQDPNWKRHLMHNNFVPTAGESLVLEI